MKIKHLFLSVCVVTAFASANAQTTVTDSLEFGKGVYNTPEYLLQGRVSGVRITTTDGSPTSAVNTNIRGLNAVRGTSEPLWIVDGAVLTSSSGQVLNVFWNDDYADYNYMAPTSQLDNLNLYDIESIQVLKNTSATALYGAKGANGVIIINTKNSGADKKGQITWNSNIGIQGASGNPHLGAAFNHNHNISFGSNANNVMYRLSAFYRDVKSAVPGVRDQVAGVRGKFDTKANKLIHFGMSANLSVGRQNSTTTTAWYGTPSMGIALRDLSIPGVINSVEGWAADYDDYAQIFRTTDAAYLQVNFLPCLKWRTDVGFDYQTNTRYFWFGDGTQFGAAFNRTAGSSLVSLMEYTAKSELVFDRYFGKRNHLVARAGAAVDGEINRFNTLNGANYTTDVLRAKGYSLKESDAQPRWTYRKYFDFGAYGQIAYDFDGIFGFDAAVRADKVERYDDDFTIYPAVNAFIDFHKAFFRDSDAFSTLRLEGGFGKAGSRKTVPYSLISRYIEPWFIADALAERGIVIDENEYTKEQSISHFFEAYNRTVSSEFNLKLGTGFWEDRVLFDVAFYNKSTQDKLSFYKFGTEKMYYERLIYRPTPRELMCEESSTIRNRGVEFDLSVNPIRTKDTDLRIFANMAFNDNSITALGEADTNLAVISTDGISANRNIIGEPVGAIWGVTTYNTDGSGNYGVIGNPAPKALGALGATLRIRRFTVDALANAAFGFYVVDLNRLWLKKQTEVSQQYLHKGDFFRLSRLSVKYDIPISVKWIKNLEASLTVTNPFTISGYTGYNPEVNSFGSISNSGVGVDYGSLPLMRTFMIGVCANF